MSETGGTGVRRTPDEVSTWLRERQNNILRDREADVIRMRREIEDAEKCGDKNTLPASQTCEYSAARDRASDKVHELALYRHEEYYYYLGVVDALNFVMEREDYGAPSFEDHNFSSVRAVL